MKVYLEGRYQARRLCTSAELIACSLMDREHEQFSLERYIVKKTVYFDQDKFFLHRKGGKSGKKGSVILAGMGRVVEIHIRYELCWNFYIAMGTLKYE